MKNPNDAIGNGTFQLKAQRLKQVSHHVPL